LSIWHFARLSRKFNSAKPISEDFSSTQHLIATIPHPGRDNGLVKPFGFHSIVDDTASIGLVVEEILDGHSCLQPIALVYGIIQRSIIEKLNKKQLN
jgi:hypothetical protein